MDHTTRHIVRALLIILPLTACATIEAGREGRASADVSLGAAPSAGGYRSDGLTLEGSIVEGADEFVAGPKTERVVGIVALAAGVVALTTILIGFYKLTQMF